VISFPKGFVPLSLVGTTLDGRYRITGFIANGGMGTIFRAEHVYMKKELALKVLRPDLSSSPDIVERFRREAEIAASLEHDNIVRVTDFGRSPEGWLFLAMELLHGESLFERLQKGPLTPESALAILVPICRGLEAAHRRGVVHRDLKPENIFLTSQPADEVKILDFGIAKLTDPQTASDTQAGVVVGTPEYLSPEQAAGIGIDARADVYAVGLMAWRMLAGRHPFEADDARGLLMMQATRPVPSLAEARPELNLSPGLVAAIAKACSKAADDRQASASELWADLEACRAPVLEVTCPADTPSARQEGPASVTLKVGRAGRLAGARYWARARSPLVALFALLGLLMPIGGLVLWLDRRPFAQTHRLLVAHQFQAARDLVLTAVARRPADPRLRLLEGRVLHRIPGEASRGVDAYAAALDLDARALDSAALLDLTDDLALDRRVAERASRLLLREGPLAIPVVVAATRTGKGPARLRALELARALGAEDRVDAAGAYGALLKDEDCEVRRAAARRLGERRERGALPALTDLAASTRRVKGFLGLPQAVPVCGALEAEAAVRLIEDRLKLSGTASH